MTTSAASMLSKVKSAAPLAKFPRNVTEVEKRPAGHDIDGRKAVAVDHRLEIRYTAQVLKNQRVAGQKPAIVASWRVASTSVTVPLVSPPAATKLTVWLLLTPTPSPKVTMALP